MTHLYHCPRSKEDDGLCRHGGKKTFAPGDLRDFCYKTKVWVKDLETCPLLEKVGKRSKELNKGDDLQVKSARRLDALRSAKLECEVSNFNGVDMKETDLYDYILEGLKEECDE